MENSQSFRAQSELSIPILSPIYIYTHTPILSDKKKTLKTHHPHFFTPLTLPNAQCRPATWCCGSGRWTGTEHCKPHTARIKFYKAESNKSLYSYVVWYSLMLFNLLYLLYLWSTNTSVYIYINKIHQCILFNYIYIHVPITNSVYPRQMSWSNIVYLQKLMI